MNNKDIQQRSRTRATLLIIPHTRCLEPIHMVRKEVGEVGLRRRHVTHVLQRLTVDSLDLIPYIMIHSSAPDVIEEVTFIVPNSLHTHKSHDANAFHVFSSVRVLERTWNAHMERVRTCTEVM